MKIKKIFLFFCSCIFFLTIGLISYGQGWRELAGEHFKVVFVQDEEFAKEVLYKTEYYYKNIASELGYPRYSEFWLWDKRVKIYIHPDHQSFLKANGQPDWSHGMADYRGKYIASYRWSKDFLDSLLPHEIGHLIFRDFVGFKGEVPLWLDEGVAQWAEEAKRDEMKAKAKSLYEQDKLLVLDDLMKLDIRRLKEIDRVYIRPMMTKNGEQGVLFLDTPSLVSTYYLQSVSLIGFLIEKYGSDRFANFCRQLRDGKSLNEALRFTYINQIHDLKELEKMWRNYLKGNS